MASYRIKRIGILQAAIYSASASFVVGLAIGVIITLSAAIWGWTTPEESGWALLVKGGFLTILFWPAYLAVIGFFSGLIFPVIYNVASSLSGGIEIELDAPAPKA